jgi:PhnB protein
MQVNAYLSFEGRCEEAIEFYKQAAGAEVTALMRWKDMPAGDGCVDPASGTAPVMPPDKIMHSELKVGTSTLMCTDGMGDKPMKFEGFSLALVVPDDAAAKKHYEALGKGGTVTMPLGPSFFATSFGMVMDRFGVSWMVVTETVPAGK